MDNQDDQQVNKDMAVEFLQLVIAGRIDEAYQKHVDMQGMHHNQYFPAGFPALKKAMLENHSQFPHKQFIMKHILASDDLVAVHSNIVLKAGEPGMAAVHIFRFQNHKIEEMWDIGQAIPADSPNKDGAF